MVVQNLAEIQNEDGGFALLPDNTDMEQEELASHRGTLVGDSTLEKERQFLFCLIWLTQ